MTGKPLLKWTGHPLVDVGVATLCAMAGKDDPTELTLNDLDAAGKELQSAYTAPIFIGYLTCVFPNSPYVNFNMKGESRNVAFKRLLQPHRADPDEAIEGLTCAFSGERATHFLDRAQMPMLTGVGVLNFFPSGRSELAVAGPYVLAVQAVALGGRRCEGKLLIVHCDQPRFTLQFATRYLARNRQLINLAKTNQLPDREGPAEQLERECAGWDSQKKKPKYPDAKAPESLIMDDLVEIVAETGKGEMARTPCSVTAYLMSNSGQGPSLAIEHIPGEFVAFLEELQGAKYQSHWKRLVSRAWRAAKGDEETPAGDGKKGKSKPPKSKPPALRGPGRSRNDLYNDLLPIFETGERDWQAAARFIRRHLLSDPSKIYLTPGRETSLGPRFGRDDLELIDWELTALFLQKVMGMNKERLDHIRTFADRLADLIDEHNDRRLFRDLVFTAGEWQYRAILTKVQRQYAHDRNSLLFGLDEYLDIFLADDAGDRVSWSLVRDLISIRLVEQLFKNQFFNRAGNADILETPEEKEAAVAS
jgi:CRISPR-associated protein Cst1